MASAAAARGSRSGGAPRAGDEPRARGVGRRRASPARGARRRAARAAARPPSWSRSTWSSARSRTSPRERDVVRSRGGSRRAAGRRRRGPSSPSSSCSASSKRPWRTRRSASRTSAPPRSERCPSPHSRTASVRVDVGLGPPAGRGEHAAVVRAAERRRPPAGCGAPRSLSPIRIHWSARCDVVRVLARREQLAEDLLRARRKSSTSLPATAASASSRSSMPSSVRSACTRLAPRYASVTNSRSMSPQRRPTLERLTEELLLPRAVALEHADVERHPARLCRLGLVAQQCLRPGQPAAHDRAVADDRAVHVREHAGDADRTQPVVAFTIGRVRELPTRRSRAGTRARCTSTEPNLRAHHPNSDGRRLPRTRAARPTHRPNATRPDRPRAAPDPGRSPPDHRAAPIPPGLRRSYRGLGRTRRQPSGSFVFRLSGALEGLPVPLAPHSCVQSAQNIPVRRESSRPQGFGRLRPSSSAGGVACRANASPG